jgi:hypothetical protein
MTDTRFVYGATCTWSGTIQDTYKQSRIPLCPQCNGPLFEVVSKQEWDDSIAVYDKIRPGYKNFCDWLANLEHCLPLDMNNALDIYVSLGNTEPLGLRE